MLKISSAHAFQKKKTIDQVLVVDCGPFGMCLQSTHLEGRGVHVEGICGCAFPIMHDDGDSLSDMHHQ